MRLVRHLMLLVLSLATLARAAAAAEPSPLDWVGHDPFEKRGEVTLFEVPAIAQQLLRLQWQPGKADYARAPIAVERREGLLVAALCERRNCGQHNWALLLDLESGEVALCSYLSRSSTTAMDYKLTLSRSFLSAQMELKGTLLQALPNGCLDPGAETLAALWDTARWLMN